MLKRKPEERGSLKIQIEQCLLVLQNSAKFCLIYIFEALTSIQHPFPTLPACLISSSSSGQSGFLYIELHFPPASVGQDLPGPLGFPHKARGSLSYGHQATTLRLHLSHGIDCSQCIAHSCWTVSTQEKRVLCTLSEALASVLTQPFSQALVHSWNKPLMGLFYLIGPAEVLNKQDEPTQTGSHTFPVFMERADLALSIVIQYS